MYDVEILSMKTNCTFSMEKNKVGLGSIFEDNTIKLYDVICPF